MRRHNIDEWQKKNKTQRFARRLTQLTMQAAKRQAKQIIRDNRRKYPVGAQVKVQGIRQHGEIAGLDWNNCDSEPIAVRFTDGSVDWYPVEMVTVK